MRYTAKTEQSGADDAAALREPLRAILRGLGLDLIELNVVRRTARKKPESRLPRGALSKTKPAAARGSGRPDAADTMSVSAAAGGTVQVRAVVYKRGALGTDDCSAAHRAIMPRLELAFPGMDLYVEVSSPGIDRLIKDGTEFTHYRGRAVRCYRMDISDWTAGILESVDENGIFLKGKEGSMRLEYEIIGKAKLDSANPVDASRED